MSSPLEQIIAGIAEGFVIAALIIAAIQKFGNKK